MSNNQRNSEAVLDGNRCLLLQEQVKVGGSGLCKCLNEAHRWRDEVVNRSYSFPHMQSFVARDHVLKREEKITLARL